MYRRGRHWAVREGLEEGHEDDQKAAAPLSWRQAKSWQTESWGCPAWRSKGFGETLIEAFLYLEKAKKNNAKIFFTKASSDMTRGNSFKLKKTDSGRIYKEDIFYNEGGEILK